ncbi:hypothetical protein LTS15_010515 [Exophiala xenobiotica]|nr:hypothetical protein LTS15_010515 [Exophiala xenobiotica]
MVRNSFASLILFLCAAQAAHSNLETEQKLWTIGQSVITSSGIIVGHAAPNATEVSEYLGIPYARAATGDLRFAPPVAYSSSDVFDAIRFSHACPVVQRTQGSSGSGSMSTNVNLTTAGLYTSEVNGEIGVQTSEDCLSLNIWTKPQVGSSPKAVMLWVYGGGFTSGNSNNPFYNGHLLANREDVVVVTFNYRINVFGFPGIPAGSQCQNVGLQDQRMAVEWVRDNISRFGGDPKRIILWGQSAGAVAIDYYAYTYTSDPIVAGFIQESGTTSAIPALNASSSASIWYNVTTRIGCGNASSDPSAVLSCMRKVNYTNILNALHGQNFYPTIDGRLVLNSSAYTALSRAGKYIQVPLLVGNNDNEAAIFRVEFVQAGSHQLDSLSAEPSYTDRRFACPAAVRANASVYHKVPTWRYRWFGVFPNTNLTTYPDSGAYHGSEIPIIFNTTPGPAQNTSANTKREEALIEYMQIVWTAFAKDPVNGLTRLGLPRFDPKEDTLLRLGWENDVGPNTSPAQVYDAPCGDQFPVPGSADEADGTDNEGSSSTASASGTASTPNKSTSTSTKVRGYCFWPCLWMFTATIVVCLT